MGVVGPLGTGFVPAISLLEKEFVKSAGRVTEIQTQFWLGK
jgi:hypothetical protein